MTRRSWLLLAIFLLAFGMIGIKFLMNTTAGTQLLLRDYEEISATVGDLSVTFHVKEQNDPRLQPLLDILPPIRQERQKYFPDFQVTGELNVYIINDADTKGLPFFQETDQVENVAYYSLNNQSIYIAAEIDNWASIFVHEYMHFTMHQFAKTVNINSIHLPLWFIEGIANSFEVRVTNAIPSSVTSFAPMPFDSLIKQTDDNSISIYTQGMYAILALIESHGAHIVQHILAETENSKFEQAFTRATAIDLTTYHEQFVMDEVLLKQLYDAVQTNPHFVIAEAEKLLAQYGPINIYGTSLMELLFEAHFALHHKQEVLFYAEQLMHAVNNPLYLMSYAKRIAPLSEAAAKEMMEAALEKTTSAEEKQQLQEAADDFPL